MPTEVARFFVEGEARPQGSKTPVRRGTKIILIEGTGSNPARHKAWRSNVADTTRAVMAEESIEELDCAARVELRFKMPRPKSRHKLIRAVTVKPDIDKLVRAVLDGLTSSDKVGTLILKDDSRVVELYAEKYYHPKDSDEPIGVEIAIFDISDRARFDQLST
jgi:Holliday junction resolvase RusA-like endonuclease